jgi:hypothetical protein
MKTAWIGVKREQRATAGNWQARIVALGLTKLGGDDLRMKVSGTEEQLAQVQNELGDLVHVEAPVDHVRA